MVIGLCGWAGTHTHTYIHSTGTYNMEEVGVELSAV